MSNLSAKKIAIRMNSKGYERGAILEHLKNIFSDCHYDPRVTYRLLYFLPSSLL